ncbi:MAG: aliphatic sulfonate transporter [Peptococcaceae bacterium]|jgi:ABC-type nitrate/sulfonate/bicarbonate transport system substrate-binding protein|nr:aliphatic sulfonate transporter [Peptococcaceae bacterium]
MLKRRTGLIALVILIAFVLTACGSSAPKQEAAKTPDKLPLVRASHQPCMHALPTWMGIEKGWPKDHGIEIKYMFFPSGAPQIEAMAAGEWDVGAMGTVPALMAALRYGTYTIAISNDESETNDVWVRKDSPLLKTKGFNPKYPEIYGTPDDWKGKTILTTTVSTGHYAVVATLKALGLTEKDVKIVNMEQSQAIAAFESGQGDILQLWAPFDYIAEQKGFVKVSSGKRAGVDIPGAVVVRKEFADKNPELVVKWLDMYMRGIEHMKKDKADSTKFLGRYFRDYCGLKLDDTIAAKEFELRPLYDLDEQLKLFEKANGTSKVDKAFADLAQFFVDQGRIKPEEKDKVLSSNFATDKFLKMLKEQRAKQGK